MRSRRDRQHHDRQPHDGEPAAVSAVATPVLSGTIAGYRIVRRLAAGRHASIYLVHADSAPAAASAPDAREPARPVVLKVFYPDTAPAHIDAEIAALSRVDSPHVLRLVDLATGPGGRPCLILDRIEGPSVADYLDGVALHGRAPATGTATPTVLSLGEAVTLLAPLCGALQSLHDRGIAHGSLSGRSVLLDWRGAPVIVGLGGATIRGSGSREGSKPVESGANSGLGDPFGDAEANWRRAIVADHRALLGLAEAVFARVASDTAPTPENIDSLATGVGLGPTHRFLPEFESWLFGLAEPQPLRADELGRPQAAPWPADVPARLALPCPAARPSAYDWGADSDGEEGPAVDGSPVPAWLAELPFSGLIRVIGDVIPPFFARRLTRDDRARGDRGGVQEPVLATRGSDPGPRGGLRRRLPLIVGGGLAMALTTVLLLVLPPGGGHGDAGVAGELTPAPSVHASAHTPASASAAAPTMTGAAAPTATDEAVILGDDPVAALKALATARDRCFTDRSADCLDGIDQQQSAAEAADRSLLNSASDGPIGGYLPIDASAATLVQRMGGSAIVSIVASNTGPANDQPASFLLVKGEAGWRIRESFAPG